ncbi:hypothetical protein C9J40_21645 [Photobacterium sp. GB-72]|nr:hypothetical protein C9J40_21645 [Photobacterium sp. GB-72]
MTRSIFITIIKYVILTFGIFLINKYLIIDAKYEILGLMLTIFSVMAIVICCLVDLEKLKI